MTPPPQDCQALLPSEVEDGEKLLRMHKRHFGMCVHAKRQDVPQPVLHVHKYDGTPQLTTAALLAAAPRPSALPVGPLLLATGPLHQRSPAAYMAVTPEIKA